MLTVVGMSSCKGDYDDWADPQTNPQEGAITIPGFTAQATSSESNPINLNNTQSVKDYKYGVKNVRVVLTPTGADAKSTTSKTIDLSNNCNADSATIQQFVSDSYGLKPVARPFTAKVLASATTGSDYVFVNAGEFPVYITPKAPVLSEVGYYVVGNVKGNGWEKNDTQYKYEFGGASPYDNPEFTIRIPAQDLTYGDHVELKILDLADVGNWDAKTVLAGNGQTAELTEDTSKPVYVNTTGTGNIQFAGTTKQYYILHVNLLDQTIYATAEDIPELFMTGSAYGWGATAADWKTTTMVNGKMNLFWTIKYVEAGEEFKFSPKSDWGGDFAPTCDGGDQKAHFTIAADGNVKCDQAGWYLLVVDRDAKTFKAYTPVVYLMGETSADGWDAHRTAADKFTLPTTKDGKFVSPALKNDKAVRIYVDMSDIVEGDWWRAEFGVASNKSIQYRGNSGTDGASYTSGAGKKIYLDFTNETGEIK